MDNLPSFTSRRPAGIFNKSAVVCGQPEAAKCGIEVLQLGGNAADAAVAVAAGMNVTQPCSTGLGGDAFCLYFDAKTKKVHGLNGSGRAPSSLTLERIHEDGFSACNILPIQHGHTVTVPGAAAAWMDTLERFGNKKLTTQQILQPAINVAKEGFTVTEITSFFWDKDVRYLQTENNIYAKDLLIEGRAPKWGEHFKNEHLAEVFEALAKEGKEGFYTGKIAENIVDAVKRFGGVMTLEDLNNHTSTFEDPISVEYNGVRLWEIAPNGQGIVALMALNILKEFQLEDLGHNSADYLHIVIEALRLGFADAMAYVADPSKAEVPIEGMISAEYGRQRSKLINTQKATNATPGSAWNYDSGTDTVYFTVVDSEGNACSFINSNYMGFGSAIVPKECGFTLQNRGSNFSLQADHPNVIAPCKRPYHTIIPAMLTSDQTGELLASYGVMGGFMQPQGHVQVLLNMLQFGMDPQRALDAPRFCIGSGHLSAIGGVSFEEGISSDVIEAIKARGHEVSGPVSGHGRALFGRGHIITKGAWWANKKSRVAKEADVLWAGSDPRTDGYPMGY